jgi:hypothetical protein
VLVGAFYVLQGMCHLIVFVFPIIVRGFNGGSIAVLGITIGIFGLNYFGLASGLSFLTALLLFLERKNLALRLGITGSGLLILFYGFLIITSHLYIVLGDVYHYSIFLIISLIIVVLNVVSVFGLYRLAKDKRIRD